MNNNERLVASSVSAAHELLKEENHAAVAAWPHAPAEFKRLADIVEASHPELAQTLRNQ